jgi:hypothetical protein
MMIPHDELALYRLARVIRVDVGLRLLIPYA